MVNKMFRPIRTKGYLVVVRVNNTLEYLNMLDQWVQNEPSYKEVVKIIEMSNKKILFVITIRRISLETFKNFVADLPTSDSIKLMCKVSLP